jgi:hypothetical protein
MLRLSGMPEADPGEDAARAITSTPKPASEHVPEPEIQPAPAIVAREPEPPPESVPPSTVVRDAQRLSFDSLWPGAERGLVKNLETALAGHQYGRALTLTEQLVARVLASAGSVLGSTPDAPRDPAVVALLLGADGRRYLEFRALVRDTRGGREVTELEALSAYAFAIELRLLRLRLRS